MGNIFSGPHQSEGRRLHFLFFPASATKIGTVNLDDSPSHPAVTGLVSECVCVCVYAYVCQNQRQPALESTPSVCFDLSHESVNRRN